MYYTNYHNFPMAEKIMIKACLSISKKTTEFSPLKISGYLLNISSSNIHYLLKRSFKKTKIPNSSLLNGVILS
jgi:hypothetical protein